MKLATVRHKILHPLLSYTTPKIVRIENLYVGILNRLIQIGIFGYIVGYVIVYKRGYQSVDTEIFTSVTSKVKGIGRTSSSKIPPSLNNRIWDTADYVIPAHENGGFFVMTNLIVTKGQIQGTCPEDPELNDLYCNPRDNKCKKDSFPTNGNGVLTGECVPWQKGNFSCEIQSWCPIEDEKTPKYILLPEARNFSVLIKNYVKFPKFDAWRRNLVECISAKCLKSCYYHPLKDPFCPNFIIGDMVARSASNFTQLASIGGIIMVQINWDCNLDFDVKSCLPKYNFQRLDDPNAEVAPGWNFRYATYYTDASGIQRRDLFKVFGIKFIFSVTGKAGKFDIIPLVVNLASGLALLVISNFICDVVLLYLHRQKSYYDQQKFQDVPKVHRCGKAQQPTPVSHVLKLSNVKSNAEL